MTATTTAGKGGAGKLVFEPPEIFQSGVTRVGAANIVTDPVDLTMREFRPLFGEHLSYPLAVIVEHLGLSPDDVVAGRRAIEVGGRSSPVRGGLSLVNFRGAKVDNISASDVLEPFFAPDFFFRDKIVLLGRTDLASKDVVYTPVPSGAIFETVPMYGVEVWKEVVDMILGATHLRRLDPVAAGLLTLLLAAAVAAGTLFATRVGALILAGSLPLLSFASYGLFAGRSLVVPLLPIAAAGCLSFAAVFVAVFIISRRERAVLTAAFGSYVSPHVLEGILNKEIALSVGGKRKKLSILFADIKGYSAFADAAEPEEVLEYVKAFFAAMNRVITKHDGVVDKLLGDGLLALYGDFTASDSHAINAVRTAIEMQEKAREISERLGHNLRMRVGINTGFVTVGNIGSEEHLDYTAIGQNVSLASRLEAVCEPGRILISDATCQLVKDEIDVEDYREIFVKGFSKAVKVYHLKAFAGDSDCDDTQDATLVVPAGAAGKKRFVDFEIIGKGGMGEVYKVFDQELSEVVVLKKLSASHSHIEMHIERLKSEVRIARKLRHQNIVSVYDFVEQDGEKYISMEWVDGADLDVIAGREGGMDRGALIQIIEQTCHAMEYAHQRGIVHRDLKLANIFVDRDGNAKVGDFGLAKLAGVDTGLTGVGRSMGTPVYMSPEQIEDSSSVTHLSDIYSYGIILYRLFTGVFPFECGSIPELVRAHCERVPIPPREKCPDIPRQVSDVIVRCLEKKPEARPQSFREIVMEIVADE